MRKGSAIALLIVSFVFVSVVASQADEIRVLGVKARPAPYWPPLAPVNGAQETNQSDNATPPANDCCRWDVPACSPAPHTHQVGEVGIMNSYWTETLPVAHSNFTVNFAAGVRANNGAGPIIPLQNLIPVSFGPVPAGTWEFCIYFTRTIPPGAQNGSPYQTGFYVETPTGTLGPAVFNTAIVIP